MQQPYDKDYLNELADKWQRGTLTEAERTYFNQWYDHWRNAEVELPEGFAKNPLELRDRNHRAILERIRLQKQKPLRHLWWPRIGIAASLLLLVSITGLYYFNRTQKGPALKAQVTRPILPGTNKAILTLAGGTRVNLTDHRTGAITAQSGSQVTKTAPGSILYRPTDKSNPTALTYNTLSTPRGGTFQVTLPDGTHAWLNAESSLRFPTAFAGKERQVEMTGEVYFEVAHDKVHPFIVMSPGQAVTVLGTHFNINAYAGEKRVTTTLLEGSVQVKSSGQLRQLRPGQQTLLQSGRISLSDADTEQAVAWKNGETVFRHTAIGEVMQTISRWYDIDVHYQTEPQYTLSGEISRSASIGEVLTMLKNSGVHYRLEGRQLIVLP